MRVLLIEPVKYLAWTFVEALEARKHTVFWACGVAQLEPLILHVHSGSQARNLRLLPVEDDFDVVICCGDTPAQSPTHAQDAASIIQHFAQRSICVGTNMNPAVNAVMLEQGACAAQRKDVVLHALFVGALSIERIRLKPETVAQRLERFNSNWSRTCQRRKRAADRIRVNMARDIPEPHGPESVASISDESFARTVRRNIVSRATGLMAPLSSVR